MANGQSVAPKMDGDPEGADTALFNEAKQALDELKWLCSEKWKRSYNKTVMKLVQGRSNAPAQQGEELIYRYLHCVELLIMRNGLSTLEDTMKELPDEVLQDGVEKFMDYFHQFVPLLNYLDRGGDPTSVISAGEGRFFQ